MNSLSRIAVAVLGVAMLAELALIVSPGAALLLVAIAAWFALPGVLFVYRALGSVPSALGSAWLVGPMLGFAFSVFGFLLLWVVRVPSALGLVLAPGFTFALAWVVRRTGGATVRRPALDRRDIAGAACALLVVPLITFAPYLHVRQRVAEGEAYRAYFTADFIWAMTVTSELAKGDLPPANPFNYPQPMRYYWMSHLLSGAEYRNVQGLGITTEQIVLVNGLMYGLAFTAFLYWLVRSVGATVGWSVIAVFVGYCANSYEGADMIRAVITHGDPWQRLQDTNIDAVTRWFYRGMAVDGLQRLLLYQPHHLAGYSLALASLWLVALAIDVTAVSIALWAGILLGLAFLFSTFAAIMMGAALSLVYVVRLVQQRAVASVWQCAILGAAPAAVGVGIAQALGYTNPDDGLLLTVGLNPVALRNAPLVVFLSFGPLLLAGVAGLIRLDWVRQRGTAPAALVLTAFAFYFLIDVPDMGGVWVGWRSGHMLLIAFAAIGGAAMSAVWRFRRYRLLTFVVALVVIAPAVATPAIDVFNAQDTTNRREGAGFPWTLIVTPEERAAFDWIRASTPANAVVQVEPFVRDPASWAYVPAFAERRMFAGLPISMIPRRGYELASQDVYWGIFRADSAQVAHGTAAALGIDYLLIGDAERRAYPSVLARLQQRPDLFEPVFHNSACQVFRVITDAAQSARKSPSAPARSD